MILRIFGSKGISFSTQEIGRKMIFFYYLRNLHDVIRNEKDDLSVLKNGDKITFSLVSNAMLTGYQKVLVLKSSEMENRVFFRAKKLMKRWYLLNTEKFLFWTFWRWEIGLFVNQKFDEKMIFTDQWKVLVLKFLEMGNTVFFEPESWWKYDIYWLLKSSCFEVFDDGKYSVFFSKKVDRKMVFTWSSWTFHNISGLGKYGFSCSGIFKGIVMQIEKTLLNDRLRVSNESWNFAS